MDRMFVWAMREEERRKHHKEKKKKVEEEKENESWWSLPLSSQPKSGFSRNSPNPREKKRERNGQARATAAVGARA